MDFGLMFGTAHFETFHSHQFSHSPSILRQDAHMGSPPPHFGSLDAHVILILGAVSGLPKGALLALALGLVAVDLLRVKDLHTHTHTQPLQNLCLHRWGWDIRWGILSLAPCPVQKGWDCPWLCAFSPRPFCPVLIWTCYLFPVKAD